MIAKKRSRKQIAASKKNIAKAQHAPKTRKQKHAMAINLEKGRAERLRLMRRTKKQLIADIKRTKDTRKLDKQFNSLNTKSNFNKAGIAARKKGKKKSRK
jgi:hypothetical protein